MDKTTSDLEFCWALIRFIGSIRVMEFRVREFRVSAIRVRNFRVKAS